MTSLRGNTFLLLLLRAAKPELYEHPNYGESRNGLTRPDMFADLIRFAKPDYEPKLLKTLGEYFSKYLSGEKPFSQRYFPFNDTLFKQGLNNRLSRSKGSVLRQMDCFCKKYLNLDDDNIRLLVASLIDAICDDKSFSGEFDIGERYVSEKELDALDKSDKILLQAFLISVWDNILLNHPNASEGSETYIDWTSGNGFDTPQSFTSDIGQERYKNICISIEMPELEPDDEPEEFDDTEVKNLSDPCVESTFETDETPTDEESVQSINSVADNKEGEETESTDSTQTDATLTSQTNNNSVVINNPINMKYFEHVDSITFQ